MYGPPSYLVRKMSIFANDNNDVLYSLDKVLMVHCSIIRPDFVTAANSAPSALNFLTGPSVNKLSLLAKQRFLSFKLFV